MKYNDEKHIRCIEKVICDHEFLTFDQLVKTNKSRKKELVLARYLIMYFLGEFTTLSTTNIAAIFNKDHSTYNHCVKTINNRNDTDKRFSITLKELRYKIINGFSVIDIKPFYDYSESIIDQSEFVCL